jgi:ClpP class serine protease
VHTAGERKMLLDPFKPERPEDVQRLKAAQRAIHSEFMALVKERRGKKLKGPEKTLFSGEFWTAGEALKLGLIDDLGDLRSALRDRYGKKVEIRLIQPPSGWFGRRVPGVSEAPADWAGTLISAIEARSIWARYGL